MYEPGVVVSTLFVVVMVRVASSSSVSLAVAPASTYVELDKTITGLSPRIVITGESLVTTLTVLTWTAVLSDKSITA